MTAATPADTPAPIAEAVRSSINAAFAVAKQFPPEIGQRIEQSARTAFSDAMNVAFLTSSGLLLVAAILVGRSMSKSATPQQLTAPAGTAISAHNTGGAE
jgi:hypothetical protein